ncbi:RNA ligase family protein [Candidatus Thiosymbion oneisti]|uniref:RNA ligase family protein n=1 Tax=Candidatus Thiosymbion oneisti TaxID=589554 RepID=UPI000B7D1158|nr:RNA ligase family protein [Candidatus Thiosymbion oneisti]
MKEYHKIQTVYKRDPATKHKTLIEGDFSLPEFEFLQHNKWIFTEKVDGTNVRVIFDGETITFGGKTDRAQIPAVLINRLNEKFLPQTDNFKEIFNGNSVCLYGEGYGAKVQPGGGKYRQDPDFVLFDVKIDEWWLQRRDVEDIAEKLGTDTVPIIGKGTLHEMVEMAKAGFKSQWGDFTAEGIVARLAIELKSRNGERIMTKIKYKDFN